MDSISVKRSPLIFFYSLRIINSPTDNWTVYKCWRASINHYRCFSRLYFIYSGLYFGSSRRRCDWRKKLTKKNFRLFKNQPKKMVCDYHFLLFLIYLFGHALNGIGITRKLHIQMLTIPIFCVLFYWSNSRGNWLLGLSMPLTPNSSTMESLKKPASSWVYPGQYGILFHFGKPKEP